MEASGTFMQPFLVEVAESKQKILQPALLLYPRTEQGGSFTEITIFSQT